MFITKTIQVICSMFFPYVCMENLVPHILDYVDLGFIWIVNWIIQAE